MTEIKFVDGHIITEEIITVTKQFTIDLCRHGVYARPKNSISAAIYLLRKREDGKYYWEFARVVDYGYDINLIAFPTIERAIEYRINQGATIIVVDKEHNPLNELFK